MLSELHTSGRLLTTNQNFRVTETAQLNDRCPFTARRKFVYQTKLTWNFLMKCYAEESRCTLRNI